MKKRFLASLHVLMLLSSLVRAQHVFKVLPLGVKGGLDESNLSAYLVATASADAYLCVDAGTVYSGLAKARKNGLLKKTEQTFLKENIKGYAISHGHLDHVAGLVMNAPEDSKKPIYALKEVIDVFTADYFTWKSWANFGSAGESPILNKYQYTALQPEKEILVAQTDLRLKAYELSHLQPYKSTAFLISNAGGSLLYLGDTGADSIEQATSLKNLWKAMAPLVVSRELKGIFIEVSFPNTQAETQLFGHLTPNLVFKELAVLASFTGAKALKGFPVVITHRKPSGNNEAEIKRQVQALNLVGLKLIFPEQGKMLTF